MEPPEPELGEPSEPTLDLETPEPIQEPVTAETESAEDSKTEPKRNARKNHPIVPSWEDVLLGVRSHR